MLFPYFISWVIVSYMLQGILGTDTGLINNLIVSSGGKRINFYSDASYWYPILLVLNLWKSTGYNSIVYLAAITGIDEGLYEAAYIDGATRFQRIRYITLPLLMPTVCIMTLMAVGRIFYGDFGMMYAIVRDNSSLMPIAEVIDTYVYRTFKNTRRPQPVHGDRPVPVHRRLHPGVHLQLDRPAQIPRRRPVLSRPIRKE